MTPNAFIAHWQHNNITERAGAQQHFNDLCEVLGVEKPRDADNYCFERGAKTQGGQGWADVWKRGCFAWEYKAPGRDLNAALKQLMNYALALDNPPLLVVSDLRSIEIHTHFTGHPSDVHRIALADLTQPETLQKLRWLFNEPERFKPQRTTYLVTEEAAQRIGEIAQRLNARGHAPEQVAHFLIQCVFCMFAEDATILPAKLFETVMDKSNPDGSKAQKRLTDLFTAMQAGGDFAMNDIPWFNGGLFKEVNVPPLETADVVSLLDAARMDWSQIEPAILGTLFERGLNPDMRSQLGAHYTDPATIMKIIRPVVEQPLLDEWQPIKASIADNLRKYEAGGKGSQTAYTQAQQAFLGFLQRLRDYRVLDPACGSGNFLYLALKTLKDLEHRANIEAEALGLHRELNIETSPANVLGIELNPYAAELARVTVWIGEIQWMLAHGYQYRKDPILAPLDHIENRDAILDTIEGTDITERDEDGNIIRNHGPAVFGQETTWPKVDAIVGNPPFLGGSKKRRELGDGYFNQLSQVYKGRVPDGADLVCYWFEKARAQIEQGQALRAGLVTTNSIRGGSNRKVLERILESGHLYEAWSDEAWVNEGAAVRVSLVCFTHKPAPTVIPAKAGIQPAQLDSRRSLPSKEVVGGGYDVRLDGQIVEAIYADLRAGDGVDLTTAKPLPENMGICFMGASKKAPLDIAGDLARAWLRSPNPHGKPNADVLRPLANAIEITRRPTDTWIIDFGTHMGEASAAQYEVPFEYVVEHVKPISSKNSDKVVALNWWRMARPRLDMREAIATVSRYIATPAVAKHRVFVWLSAAVLPDQAILATASDDDATFGILHSRFHELWSLKMCTWMGVGNDPRYTPTTCFETFPFPAGLTPQDPRGEHATEPAIAQAAQQLNQLREQWLNPTEWVDWVITPEEAAAGYPQRAVAKAGFEAELKKRTLTNLYNQRPTWLVQAHQRLDAAVALAYGWEDYTPDMPDDEILRRLLQLNLARSGDSQ